MGSESEHPSATVAERHDAYYVVPELGIAGGPRFGAEEVLAIPKAAGAAALGEAVATALGMFRIVTDNPSGKGSRPILLALSGLRSMAAFERGTRWCAVFANGDQVDVVPFRRVNSKAMVHRTDKKVSMRLPSAIELGNLLEQGMQNAEAG